MVNKKDDPGSATAPAKRRYALSTSRGSSVDKQQQASTTAAMGSPGNSKSGSSPSAPKKLGSAPKANESPLKQALVIHHANVQQISVNWFKLLSEQMDAMKRSEHSPGTPTSSKEKTGDSRMSKSAIETKAANPSPNANVATARASIVTDSPGASKEKARRNLIHPGEVQVSQHVVHEEAQVLLTPNDDVTESLRRYDEAIAEALQDKNDILSKMFDLPKEDLEELSESILTNKFEIPSTRYLVLASILQTDRLLEAINSTMKILPATPSPSPTPTPTNNNNVQSAPNQDAPAVPCRQLGLIVPPLLKHLGVLLQIIKSTEEELKISRIELLRCKAEAGSCSSLVRESPTGSVHNALSAKSSQSDADMESLKKIEEENIDDVMRTSI